MAYFQICKPFTRCAWTENLHADVGLGNDAVWTSTFRSPQISCRTFPVSLLSTWLSHKLETVPYSFKVLLYLAHVSPSPTNNGMAILPCLRADVYFITLPNVLLWTMERGRPYTGRWMNTLQSSASQSTYFESLIGAKPLRFKLF